MSIKLRITAAVAGAFFATTAFAQHAVDPKLADAWKFMQANMPGVPYKLLEEACKDGTLTIYNGTWGDAQRSQVEAFKKRFP